MKCIIVLIYSIVLKAFLHVLWSFTRVIHVPFFCFCLTAGLTVSSSIRILDKRQDCNQLGLKNCQIKNCPGERIAKPRQHAPNGPEVGPHHLGVWMDEHGPVSVVNVSWTIKSDGNVKVLRGSQIDFLDESTNQSLCVQFVFNLSKQQNPNLSKWTFSLDGVVVEPHHSYRVSILNLPEPEDEPESLRMNITIPGCDDTRIQEAQMCLENGSLWDPHINHSVDLNKGLGKFSINVLFEAAQYSERYQVSIHSKGFNSSKSVSKENKTWLTVTFEFGWRQLPQCKMELLIQPFFVRCKNDCWRPKKDIDLCKYYPPRTLIIKACLALLVFGGVLAFLLWTAFQKDPVNSSLSAAKQQPEGFQVRERRRLLVIYSLDHPLYKNIVLKLSAFLATKCGTEVFLDLLDSTRLGVLGSVQWLDWHREQIESSKDKILILCSRGVKAKWKAMCGDKQVFLREDARSPMGDMLSPALSLMVPHFIRSSSFEKYIVAYFDDVCSEDDVPSPFNITLRYKLMKQFEELFFRILNTEKHEPGKVNHIDGLSEEKYHQCASGRALRDAIEAFHAYQLEHPQWFEEELLESSNTSSEICDDAKSTINLITYREPESAHVTSHLNTQETDFIVNTSGLYVAEELQMRTSVEFNQLISENMQHV
ncbi:interleukin-17 receptor A [Pseudochaenichthys georgianus]|uniref:interleukin-17 receptor A n=1 Tax=Pseudochaenichthys georgianus TaxID=52239 RepID=UPI00146CDE4D|nr:interleukin-17 receptor A [Pseudochaenichthys georgianus]